MLNEILDERRTDVQPDSGNFSDPYEDLIAKLHQFLDRLVAESREDKDDDCVRIFIGGNSDE